MLYAGFKSVWKYVQNGNSNMKTLPG